MHIKTKTKYRNPNIQWEAHKTRNKKQQNNQLRTDSGLSHYWGDGRGSQMHFTGANISPRSFVKIIKMFGSNRGFLTPQRNNLIKLTHYDDTKKRAHDTQIVDVKENLRCSHGGTSQRFLALIWYPRIQAF